MMLDMTVPRPPDRRRDATDELAELARLVRQLSPSWSASGFFQAQGDILGRIARISDRYAALPAAPAGPQRPGGALAAFPAAPGPLPAAAQPAQRLPEAARGPWGADRRAGEAGGAGPGGSAARRPGPAIPPASLPAPAPLRRPACLVGLIPGRRTRRTAPAQPAADRARPDARGL